MLYLWLKALHIVAVVAWMAGMLYLPRLFVYHADAPTGSPQSHTELSSQSLSFTQPYSQNESPV